MVFNNNANATNLKRRIVYWDNGEWKQLTVEQIHNTIAGNAISMTQLLNLKDNVELTSPDGLLTVRMYDCNNGGCLPQFKTASANGNIIKVSERKGGNSAGSYSIDPAGFQILTAENSFHGPLSGLIPIRMLTLSNAEI